MVSLGLWLTAGGSDIVRNLTDKADDGTTRMQIERLSAGEAYKSVMIIS